MTDFERGVYTSAIEKWGKMPQLFQLLEEMAELEIEVHKIRRGRNEDMLNFAREVADVTVMIEQMHVMFGPSFTEVVNKVRERKIKRLHGRIFNA